MSHCPNCGAQTADGATFCPSCGARATAAKPRPAGKLHCPHCGSYNISVTTESSIGGALTTSRGRMSATAVSNIHRNFWVCGDCGNKFRNIQNLEEEIEKVKKQRKITAVLAAIALVITIFLVINIANNPLTIIFIGGPMAFVSGLFTLVCGGLTISYGSNVKKMKVELAALKEKCFN